MEIKIPIFIVISSEGIAAKEKGQCLGLYQYDSENDCYKQVSSEEDKTFRYLYRQSDGDWWIGSTPRESRGWLKNKQQRTETVPTSGWMVSVGNDKPWKDDR